jgi:hypothetical protein
MFHSMQWQQLWELGSQGTHTMSSNTTNIRIDITVQVPAYCYVVTQEHLQTSTHTTKWFKQGDALCKSTWPEGVSDQ